MVEVYGKGIDSGIVFYYTNDDVCKVFNKIEIDDQYYYINCDSDKVELI